MKNSLTPMNSQPHSQNGNLSSFIVLMNKQLVAIEVFSIFVGSLVVSIVRLDVDILEVLTQYPGFPKVFAYPLLWYFFLYSAHAWDRSILHNSNEYYVRVLKAGFQSLLGFAAFAYLLKYPISRMWVLVNAVTVTLILLGIRFILRWFYLSRRELPKEITYIYVGKPEDVSSMLNTFEHSFRVRPHIVVLEPPSHGAIDSWLKDYERKVEDTHTFGAIVGMGAIQDAALLRQLVDLRRDRVIHLILDTRLGTIAPRFEQLDSPTLVKVRESTIVSSGAVLKRIFDVVFSLLVLIATLPLLALISVIVKVTTPGPVLYIDQRVGKDGKLFTFPKFRSMYLGSDIERLSVLGRPDQDMSHRYKSDPRITPFGHFIRRWSLDEIPQFWCVLMGTMSVVGPRPVLQEEIEQIEDLYQIRFLAKPGLTGLWQVTGRKEVAWNDRMVRDISYIDNWSFFNDLVLIGRTVSAIVKGEGAH